MNLKQKALKGFKWTAIEQGLVQGLNFFFAIIMARLLNPSDFGLIAMVTVFTGFLSLFIDGGLGSALIYQNNITEADKSSMFWVNIFIGFALFLILSFSSSLISDFYHESILILITPLVASNFLINSTITVQLSLLRKNLDFKKIFYARLLALVLSGFTGILMAYGGYGVWSIISRMLLMTFIFSLSLWYSSVWRPLFIFDWVRLKIMLNYSIPLLGNNLLGYFKKNIDTLIIGKTLGTASLGVYNKSYQLMVLPGNQITGMVGHVLFASFSKINNNKQLLWRAYVLATKGILILSTIMALSIFFTAESFVINILGEKWIDAIDLIKIMALVGYVHPVIKSVGALFNATGATMNALKISLITTPIYLLAVWLGSYWGLKGIAFGVSGAILLNAIPQLHYAVKLVDKTAVDLLFEYRRILLAGGICFFIVRLLKNFIGNASNIFWLPVVPCLITLILFLLSQLIFKKDLMMLYKLIKSK